MLERVQAQAPSLAACTVDEHLQYWISSRDAIMKVVNLRQTAEKCSSVLDDCFQPEAVQSVRCDGILVQALPRRSK